MVIEILCNNKEITIHQLNTYIEIIQEAYKKGYKRYKMSMCKCLELVEIIEAYGLTSIESQKPNLTVIVGDLNNGRSKTQNQTATITRNGKIYSSTSCRE